MRMILSASFYGAPMQIEPEEIQLKVNGKVHLVRVDSSTPLLYVPILLEDGIGRGGQQRLGCSFPQRPAD